MLEKKITKYRKKLRDAAFLQNTYASSAELVVSQYWEQLPYNDHQRAMLDRIYGHIDRRINSLKRRTRKRLKTLFSKDEQLGESLDISRVETVIKGPFRKYFLTRRLVEYMQDFLHRSLKRRVAREEVERTEIRGIEDLLERVHCLYCNKAISRSVLQYHLKGKEHIKKMETGSIFKETSNDVSGMSTEDGFVSVGENDLFCTARELKTLVRSLYSVKGLNELNENILIDLASMLDEPAANARPKNMQAKRAMPVHTRKEPSFYCEVCSSAITGTSTFYAHFLEERHVQSLETLGTTDVERCFGVTKIALVMELIQNVEEEEDIEGNVYDKRTYDDLARNGLI